MNSNIEVTYKKALNYIKFGYAKKQFPSSPELSNDHKLKLYGLYKVISEGPNNTPYPGVFDFTGKAKWNAWKEVSSLSKNQAMQDYVKLLNKLAPKWDKFYDSQKIIP